jgi:hypothetical protein
MGGKVKWQVRTDKRERSVKRFEWEKYMEGGRLKKDPSTKFQAPEKHQGDPMGRIGPMEVSDK